MIILTIRTDKPEAELALFDNDTVLSEIKWEAHRILADTIHQKISEILQDSKLSLGEIKGIVCFRGPGSFTGLRIGLTVANTLAYALSVPIIAENSVNWKTEGIKKLLEGKSDKIALPEYGAEAKTTKPKK